MKALFRLDPSGGGSNAMLALARKDMAQARTVFSIVFNFLSSSVPFIIVVVSGWLREHFFVKV